MLALVPAWFVGRGRAGPGTATDGDGRAREPLSKAVRGFVWAVARDSGLRRVIGLELTGNLLTRWAKVFWVIHAAGRFEMVFIGTTLSAMFAASLACKPAAGWLGGRFGPRRTLTAGAFLMAGGIAGLFLATGPLSALFFALCAGAGDGFVMPGVLAMVAYGVPAGSRGAAMGVLESCRNAGKAMGPLLGGLLSAAAGTTPTALVGAGMLAILAARIWGLESAMVRETGSGTSA